MTTVLELTEYESHDVDLPISAANAIQRTFGERITIRPTGGGRWRLTAQQFVGTLRVDDVVVHIRPKVGLGNLLALMDVEVPSEIWRSEVVSLERDPDLLAVMARLFCVAVEDLTRRGLRRSYVTRQERLVAPRGRIDVIEVIRRPGLTSPIPCRFDEHTADTPLNQVVKAGLEAARRVPSVSPQWQRRLLAQLGVFEGVEAGRPNLEWLDRWEPASMDLHYETAVRLAAMLLRSTSLAAGAGAIGSNSFLLDMNSLFEKWVGRRLKQIMTVDVKEQWSISLGTAGEVSMSPDLTFWVGDRPIAVADCKYKLLHDGIGRSNDYYQALAYSTAMQLPECWLIYARLPGDPHRRDVEIRNAGVVVRTSALDLSGPIDAAVEQLRGFASRLVGSQSVNAYVDVLP